jgi:GNAT superfamily N-acetyltransferase
VKGFLLILTPTFATMIALPICDFERAQSARLERAAVPAEEAHGETDENRAWEWIYRPDAALSEDEDRRLRRLLVSCFAYNPYFRFRRFHLERPGHHWLARSASGRFVAHAAVHEKVLGAECGEIQVGGVADVCVAADHRGLGILKAMLGTIHDWIAARQMPFSMLFGKPRVYASSGYSVIGNELHASNSIARSWMPMKGKPMVKSLANIPWPNCSIDLRGPTF